LGATHVRTERLFAAAQVERQIRKNLAEQTMATLRGLEKNMEKERMKVVEKPVGGTVMLEKAAVKDAKD
jgi:hypothetical protein